MLQQNSNIIKNKQRNEVVKMVLDAIQHVLILIAFLMFFSFVQVATATEEQGSTLLLETQNSKFLSSALMVKTDIDMRITGMINRAQVTQVYKNTSDEWVDGTYRFPLPESATVDAMQIQVGGRIINADIKARSIAKRYFQTEKKTSKRTLLLEQYRPNIFSSSIVNIAPGEEIKIEISFQNMVQHEDGEFKLRFPMAILPRYIPGISSSEQGNFISTKLNDHSTLQQQSIRNAKIESDKAPVSLHVELDAGFPLAELESRYHAIHKTNHGLGRYSIRFQLATPLTKRDFELFWRPEPDHLPRTAIFHEKVGDEHHYFAMLYPQEPEMSDQALLNKEVVYVIDTSGSMAGTSIRQARESILVALKELDPEDYFNIITFNTQTHSVFERPMLATLLNIARARQFIAQTNARGGTEMLPALRKALASNPSEHRLRQIVYLTDGAVVNEQAIFNMIRSDINKNRLFTIGIGSSPNSYFLRQAAHIGRGTYTYISDVNEVSERLGKLLKKINRPVLHDIKIESQTGAADIVPRTIPDLYVNEPVFFSMKTKESVDKIKLVGFRSGEKWSRQLSLVDSDKGFGIAKQWARQKINVLMEEMTTQDSSKVAQLEKSILDIALKYKIMSQYTSLIIMGKSVAHAATRNLNQYSMPTNSVTDQVAFIKTSQVIPISAKTATDAQLKFIVGLISLLLALAVRLYLRRRFSNQEWF